MAGALSAKDPPSRESADSIPGVPADRAVGLSRPGIARAGFIASWITGGFLQRIPTLGRRWARSFDLPMLLAYLTAIAYVIGMSYLSFLKFYTFHDTFADLGVYNQQLWLLDHGGFALLDSSHFNTQIYNFQYQEGIIFVVFGFYALRPDITTLLYLQSAALGLAAIPLFHLAGRRLGSRWLALAVTVSYLVFFPVASGNLVDFHLENFTPFLFLSMALAWQAGWRRAGYLFAALTALVNPLTLLLVVFFLSAQGLPVDAEGRLAFPGLSAAIRGFLRDRIRVAFTTGLLALFVLYRVLGTLPVAGVGSGTTGLDPLGTVFFAINGKLALLVLLLGAVAFLSLFDWRSTFVLLPYFGFVLYSTDTANWVPFGLMYTNMAVGPIYLGVVNTLARWRRGPAPTANAAPGPTASTPARSPRWAPGGAPPSRAPVAAFLLVSAVFGFVYFPGSPANQYVQGGYFAGNHDVATVTSITPQVTFLWRALDLVPANGAVLTQNNIPQLTGRVNYQIGPVVQPDIPYDYILLDGAIQYFSTAADLIPFAAPALSNGSFGVLAEGQGALLLERGFNGSPRLYDPHVDNLTGNQLADFSGAVVGTTIVGSGPAFSLWYGPSATLFPGSYAVTFAVSVNTTTPNATRVISLDTVSGGGSVRYASQNLYTSNFTAPDAISLFTLRFSLTKFVSGIEYRGMFPTGAATVTLHYISIVQTALPP